MKKALLRIAGYVVMSLLVASLWASAGSHADWNPFATGFFSSAGLIAGQILRRKIFGQRPRRFNPADEF